MTEPPKNLRKGHRRCTQAQCGYYQNGGCKECESCQARPFEINTSCGRCLSCENVPGKLRWDDKEKKEAFIPNKELERTMLRALIEASYNRLKDIENEKRKEETPPQGEIIVREVKQNGKNR